MRYSFLPFARPSPGEEEIPRRVPYPGRHATAPSDADRGDVIAAVGDVRGWHRR